MPGGPKLTPSDPEKRKVMDKWVNQGAMIMRLGNIFSVVQLFLLNRGMQVYISRDVDKKNPWKGLESRAGNLLGAITMPVFAAHVYVNFRFAFLLM